MRDVPLKQFDKHRVIIYDITRLVTRGLNKAPNGIDRIDFALARYFLSKSENKNLGFIYTVIGPRLIDPDEALKAIDIIENYWDENPAISVKNQLDEIIKNISNEKNTKITRIKLKSRFSWKHAKLNIKNIWNFAIRFGVGLEGVPPGSVYLNASQFLLDREWFFERALSRSDLKYVFYIHDLIALENPEYFTQSEALSFNKKIRHIFRHADGLITGASSIEKSIDDYPESSCEKKLPIYLYEPIPPSIFGDTVLQEDLIKIGPYFIICGTIEPRKNHLFLLHLWDQLAKINCSSKLFIIGKRGWLNDEVIGYLEKNRYLRSLVYEIDGISTPGLAQILKGARALLVPSLSEGFGLPIIEAIAAGVPVIASDIQTFRDVGKNALDYISPLDGNEWLEAIKDYSKDVSPRRLRALEKIQAINWDKRKNNLTDLNLFLQLI